MSFKDFRQRCRELAVRGGGWEMWGRASQNALIIAGIVAVGISPHRPRITSNVAQWATKFMEWTSDRWTKRIEESSSRSSTEVTSKFLERTVRNAREFVERTLGNGTEKALVKRGFMPRSLLLRLSRHIRTRDFDESLTSLAAGNLLVFGEIDGIECYWIR